MIYPQHDTALLASTDIGIVVPDRRRPGRQDVSPALIPLLRGTVSIDLTSEASHPEGLVESRLEAVAEERAEGATEALASLDDAGNPARGVLIAMLLMISVWCAIAEVVYRVLLH